MKHLFNYIILASIALAFASCVHDLNVTPIDPNSNTEFNADAMFTKCYSCLGLTGQTGDAESDVDKQGIDAGTSGFYRMTWYCNEFPTDEVWWTYNDEESKQLTQTNWTGTNLGMWAIYIRLILDIKYCNHYLARAPQDTQEEQYRHAEVRFIRALHYFYLMDMYLYAPFIIEDSNVSPHFKSRHYIYAWLVDELKDLINNNLLPKKRVNDYRVGKAAAQLLLARIYLNGDVYNKFNKNWTEGSSMHLAWDMANKTIEENKGIHDLVTKDQKIVTDSGFVYTAYQQLFMGDNNRPEIIKESLLQIYQDGFYAHSYAGTSMLIKGPRCDGMVSCGSDAGLWHAMRTSPTMVDKFIKLESIGRSQAQNMIYNEYDMPAKLNDDRAILCSKLENASNTFKLTGPQGTGDNAIYECWAPLKFTGVWSSAALPKLSPRQDTGWPDTDIPFLRLAEAYLIRGEAAARESGNWNNALDDVNVLRERANAKKLTVIDEETMLDEWSREFWFEGRRRMDLIRFGRFFGPESDLAGHKYHWEGRAGLNDDDEFREGTPEYMNWFPVPSDDKRNNPNYQPDVEEDPDNQYASRGGDGYPY